jgi:hypothetical protein
MMDLETCEFLSKGSVHQSWFGLAHASSMCWKQ